MKPVQLFSAGLALLAASLLLTDVARAATLSTDNDGVRVDAGPMGAFVLQYPILVTDSEQEAHKIIGKETAGKTATIKYEGGSTLVVDASHDGQITYAFAQVPADVKKWKVTTMIDFSFAQGGKWKFGDGAETPFPLVKPNKPHLFQGKHDVDAVEGCAGPDPRVSRARVQLSRAHR